MPPRPKAGGISAPVDVNATRPWSLILIFPVLRASVNRVQSERRACSRESHQIHRGVRSEREVGAADTWGVDVETDGVGLPSDRFDLISKVKAASCSVSSLIGSIGVGLGELTAAVSNVRRSSQTGDWPVADWHLSALGSSRVAFFATGVDLGSTRVFQGYHIERAGFMSMLVQHCIERPGLVVSVTRYFWCDGKIQINVISNQSHHNSRYTSQPRSDRADNAKTQHLLGLVSQKKSKTLHLLSLIGPINQTNRKSIRSSWSVLIISSVNSD